MTQAPKSQPELFDPQALRNHRARHQRAALFLHDLARDEVEDRLSLVNRTFTSPAIVTPFAEVWRDSLQDAKIVHDDDVLDLTPGTHDLVVHAMGLHWANDPVGQLIQCRRALREDGLLLAITLGGRTLHELRAAPVRPRRLSQAACRRVSHRWEKCGSGRAAATGGLCPAGGRCCAAHCAIPRQSASDAGSARHGRGQCP